ncbi:unnamed protein product, partial [Protopolystoma xenopodis]
MHLEIAAVVDFVCHYLYNNLPRRRVTEFSGHLAAAIHQRLIFTGCWRPEAPHLGMQHRCFRLTGPHADADLLPATVGPAGAFGLSLAEVTACLPGEELTFWIDPGEVTYRVGLGEIQTLCLLGRDRLAGSIARADDFGQTSRQHVSSQRQGEDVAGEARGRQDVWSPEQLLLSETSRHRELGFDEPPMSVLTPQVNRMENGPSSGGAPELATKAGNLSPTNVVPEDQRNLSSSHAIPLPALLAHQHQISPTYPVALVTPSLPTIRQPCRCPGVMPQLVLLDRPSPFEPAILEPGLPIPSCRDPTFSAAKFAQTKFGSTKLRSLVVGSGTCSASGSSASTAITTPVDLQRRSANFALSVVSPSRNPQHIYCLSLPRTKPSTQPHRPRHHLSS